MIELDEVDRGILHMLQENARETTAAEMGEAVGVSASTVRNRIARLEDAGVIRGYLPDIDYERAQYQLHVMLRCHAPVQNRSDLTEAALDLEGVVTVREMLTGGHNLHIEAVGTDSGAVDRITAGATDLGLEIESVDVIKTVRVQPFDHFGVEES